MRTLEQLRARTAAAKVWDALGLAIGDLLIFDPLEMDALVGHEGKPLETAAAPAEASLRDYLPFAFDKAINHRSISASRSFLHITNWLWLMERDDLLAFAEDDTNYRYYDVPILKHVARALGVPLPDAIESWQDGKACREGCDAGCNS